MNACFNCRSPDIQAAVAGSPDVYEVKCAICGDYTITETAIVMNHKIPDDHRWLVSAWIRDRNYHGEKPEINSKFKENIFNHVNTPDVQTKFDRFLLRLAESSKYPGSYVSIVYKIDYPLYWTSNGDEIEWMIDELKKLNYVDVNLGSGKSYDLRLTGNGWEKVRVLKQEILESSQVFVAMWFDPSMNDVYEEGIKAAIEDDLGYSAMRIDRKEHLNRIDDEIILEIRRSRALIADFTMERGGVYFEAGFALGLNKPVVWTCREDQIDEVHFDTRQYNFILWKDPRELREGLKNRFLALNL